MTMILIMLVMTMKMMMTMMTMLIMTVMTMMIMTVMMILTKLLKLLEAKPFSIHRNLLVIIKTSPYMKLVLIISIIIKPVASFDNHCHYKHLQLHH